MKPFDKGTWFYRFTIILTKLYFSLFFRVEKRGKPPCPKGGGIIVSNHISLLDPPLIATSFPEAIHFFAKRSLFTPFFGGILRKLNAHPVDRGQQNRSLLKKAHSIIEGGKKVLIFPEGTRSKDGNLGTLKGGAAYLMVKTKAPTIPVWLSSERKNLSITYGLPIVFSEFAHMNQQEQLDAITKKLNDALIRLQAINSKKSI
ncbi:MAG: lysophospholipid acyltransferase family protein [Chlamydiota bacterium]|nr:lysophospholipid acyltransferase family protein [Chlamydiota bacterium]